jgi:Holliday junction resolvase
VKGIDCERHHLELAYDKYRARLVLEEDTDNISDEDSQINMIWHYLYRKSKDIMVVDDNQKMVSWMNEDLERSAFGQLKSNDTMAMVQYVVAMRAGKRGFRCLGVEYSLYGYQPDVVLKSGKITIVIECKNTKRTIGKRQVENYLRSLKDDGVPALGILFSQREIKFYSLEPLSKSIIGNAKELVFDVLSELQTRSEHFGTNHFSTIDRCGAVELQDEEQHAEKQSEYMVNDPMFGLTFMRRTEVGDIPYDADGNFNHAMFARDL